MSEEKEFSEDGVPILRPHRLEPSSDLAPGNAENIAAITEHIERYIGPPAWVFHEIISEFVEEMELKLNKGSDALWDALAEEDLTQVVNPRRRNVAKER